MVQGRKQYFGQIFITQLALRGVSNRDIHSSNHLPLTREKLKDFFFVYVLLKSINFE